jgi:hypothetical protein
MSAKDARDMEIRLLKFGRNDDGMWGKVVMPEATK